MVWGFLGLVASQVILVLTPPGDFALLTLSTLIEGAAFPVASTLLDTWWWSWSILRNGRASWPWCM